MIVPNNFGLITLNSNIKTGRTTAASVTFDTPFPGKPVVIAIPNQNSNTSIATFLNIVSVSSTGFTVDRKFMTSGNPGLGNSGIEYQWIAIYR